MTPERWQQIETLFQAAVEHPPEARPTFLAQACHGDEGLRREVEALLAADVSAEADTLAMPAQIATAMFAEQQALQPGQMLNHYRIVSQLGAGGMGVVYLAEDTRLQRKVALKVLPAQFTQQPDRIRRFIREAQSASALNHPNILTIYEIGETGATHFIVTEFIDGQTLRAWLRSNNTSLVTKLDLALQIASALAATHEAGIIHRDLKPENVMVRRDGLVKMLDFGLAKLTEQRAEAQAISHLTSESGVVMGTASYMSPEQARGEKVDARTDIFSFGIVLYEMFTGHLPFAGTNTLEVLAAILEREPAPLTQHNADVPEALQSIVRRALRKDREQRYQNIQEMQGALERLREEMKRETHLPQRPVSAPPAQTTSAGTPTAITKTNTTSSAEIILAEIKRHKRGVLTTLAIVSTLLAGGAFVLYKFFWNPVAPNKPVAALKVTPLTTFAGLESKPSFSPDGNQIAFSWVGESGDNTDIYIKEIGGEGMRRLTTHPGIDSDAVWSPDGRSIAFFRITEEGGAIYVMPSLGGVERKLTDISPLRPPQVLRGEMSWSPDGKTLVFPDRNSAAEPLGLTVLNLETGEKRVLLPPVPGSTGDYSPVFSPDGKTIAFNRSVGGEPERDIYLVPATGGTPEKITSVNTFLISVDWLPDGKSLIYCASGATREHAGVWRVSLASRSLERVAGREVGTMWGVVMGQQEGKMMWIRASYSLDIWRMGLQNRRSDNRPPAKFLSSTTSEPGVRYSPDGKKITILSDRSGETQAWVADADGQNLTLFSGDKEKYEFPTWSPDGKKIAFDSKVSGKHAIFVMNAEGGQRTPLVQDEFNNTAPNWSADGKWIYFGSDRGGAIQLWKIPAEGGQLSLVMKQRLTRYAESWEGKSLIYSKGYMVPGLWRYDFATGAETLLTTVHSAGYWHSWEINQRGIYFATCETPLRAMVEFYDFATGKVSLVAKLKTPFPAPLYGLSVSPDEKWLCYMQQELDGDLLLMENVR